MRRWIRIGRRTVVVVVVVLWLMAGRAVLRSIERRVRRVGSCDDGMICDEITSEGGKTVWRRGCIYLKNWKSQRTNMIFGLLNERCNCSPNFLFTYAPCKKDPKKQKPRA